MFFLSTVQSPDSTPSKYAGTQSQEASQIPHKAKTKIMKSPFREELQLILGEFGKDILREPRNLIKSCRFRTRMIQFCSKGSSMNEDQAGASRRPFLFGTIAKALAPVRLEVQGSGHGGARSHVQICAG